MEKVIIFYTVSFLILTFLLISIICKNLFYSLTASIFVFILTGFIFYLLDAEYNAIIQVMVYGVAIPIILGLSIMFNNSSQYKNFKNSSKILNRLIIGIGFLLFVFYFYSVIIKKIHIPAFTIHNFQMCNNTLNLICSSLFDNHILVFEMISITLTVAIIGFSLFKKEIKK